MDNQDIGILGIILQFIGLFRGSKKEKELTGICPNADFDEESWKWRGACRCRIYNQLITDPSHVWKYCEKYYMRCKGNNGIVLPKL